MFDAEDPDRGLLAGLFDERVRAGIEATANALLAERTRAVQSALAAGLAQALPPILAADLSGLPIAQLQIEPAATGLVLSGWAQGSLNLKAAQTADLP